MPVRPSYVSERPTTLALQSSRGDVLADVLGAALLPNAIYRRLEARAPWGIRVPPKPRATFYLFAHGGGLVELDGAAPVRVAPGEVVFLPHGGAHVVRDAASTTPTPVCDRKREGVCATDNRPRRIGGTGARTSILTGFYGLRDRVPALLQNMPAVVHLSLSDREANPWFCATVELLIAESASPGPASALVLQRLADVLFVQALRSLTRQNPCTQPGLVAHPGLAALGDPQIHEALALMHARVDAPWTVAELAAKVGLSRSGFAARFSQLVGEPPLQYLARWRVARAAELLRETKDGIADIAGRVGYESVPSFSKAFKKWRGTSPAAWRRSAANAVPVEPPV